MTEIMKGPIDLEGIEKGDQKKKIDEDIAVEVGIMKENEDTGSIDIDQEVVNGNIISVGMMLVLEEGQEVAVQQLDLADIEAEVLIEDIAQGEKMRVLETTIHGSECFEEVARQTYETEMKGCQRDNVNCITIWGGSHRNGVDSITKVYPFVIIAYHHLQPYFVALFRGNRGLSAGINSRQLTHRSFDRTLNHYISS